VSIETQSQASNGNIRETFDIRVFDGDRNEDKSASDMSGGERIYINEAMTRAIAIYQAQQSGQQYGTLFSDESDGALDPKRKVMFTNMKRKVLELGGYEREIFITHTPELWDLADAVIDFDSMRVD
jgi:exonuclease SbcC